MINWKDATLKYGAKVYEGVNPKGDCYAIIPLADIHKKVFNINENFCTVVIPPDATMTNQKVSPLGMQDTLDEAKQLCEQHDKEVK